MITTNDMGFCNLNRKERIKSISETEYDLIIIGGGITGAGIAWDASLRGIKTLLVEKGDFASGTSSKSTKLIHGGLRYLKQFEFGLVRETGMERAVVHKNIPHLVHPEVMFLPIVEGGEFTKLTASMAIFVYDYLANVEKKDRKKSYKKSRVLTEEPLLNPDILKSAIAYSEYRTDDARLTIELVKASHREGAEAINYMMVNEMSYVDGKVNGVHCQDVSTGEEHFFKSKAVVSAAGPWVDKLRQKDHSLKGSKLHLTKGVHIVIPHDRFPIVNSVYFDAFDGRMIFAIPRGKVTYIGTSDTEYHDSLDRVLCNKADVKYLLEKVNGMFPSLRLEEKDVASSWAGLRPLIHEEGKSPSELSRKDEIFISDTNLISIAGGKLTGFRKMSKKIVKLLLKRDPLLPQVKCKTKRQKIHVDSFLNYNEYEEFYKLFYKQNSQFGLTKYDAWYLTTTYGKTAKDILALAQKKEGGSLEEKIIKAEIHYGIEHESVLLPDDFFIRRSGRLFFDVESVKTYFDLIFDEFSQWYGWTAEKKIKEISRCRQLLEDVTVFY